MNGGYSYFPPKSVLKLFLCTMGIPVAHEFGIKESGDSMKQLLQYIKYDTYKWNNFFALLLGVQFR